MTRNVPRRPASSRAPTSRPRRIAGRGSVVPPAAEPDAPTEPSGPPETEDAPPVEPVEAVEAGEPAEVEVGEPDRLSEEPAETGPRGMGVLFASRRTTRALVAIAAVMAVVAAGLVIWLWRHDEGGVDARPSTEEGISVPEGRPVLISAEDAQVAVAAAAEAASTIVATSYEDYDEQVEEAAALMTDEFAVEYRQTAEDVKQRILDTKTEVQVRIVAQGVVRANTSEVEALLFLNQYSTKDGGKTTYTPYRALVTVVHTDGAWLVSGLDTQ